MRHFLGLLVAIGCCPALYADEAKNAKSPAAAVVLVQSRTSGDWSSPDTWNAGKVPAAGQQVLIREGDTVVYDVNSAAVIRSLHISGTLTFATDRTTQLNVGLIRIQPGDEVVEEGFDCDHIREKTAFDSSLDTSQPGFSAICVCCQTKAALLVGTPEQPIPPQFSATIRLHHISGMNPESCPAIVCCGGRMDFHGAPLSRTWVSLGATLPRDGVDVQLPEPVHGWRAGDSVLLTGSDGTFGQRRPQSEVRTIAFIKGSRILLDAPVAYTHNGVGEFRSEIANLSRNVIVESATPDGVRGHTMYHAGSAGSISYAEFRHLGKRGVLGRYPLHFHLCKDTMRGSSVVGASIRDSHNRFVAIHGTEYLLVRDCVGFRSVGHGFFLEDGTEVDNVLDRNLACQTMPADPLPKQALPFDNNAGAGFWWANSRNTFTRNTAADCLGYGFRYEATPRAGFDDHGVVFGNPRQSFDLRLPVLQADGARKAVDIRRISFVRFDGNSAHNIGDYGLNMGEGAGAVGPPREQPFVIRNMKIWNAQRGYTVHVPNVRIDGMQIHRCGYEVYRARYVAQDYRNVILSGIRGRYTVSNRENYLLSGQAVGEDGVGLNRSRLPGFPRGTGAGGTSYLGADTETAQLTPVDIQPPTTVITSTRRDGNKLIVTGCCSDDGTIRAVSVNGQPARSTGENFFEWQVTLNELTTPVMQLTATAEDTAGNRENTPHKMTVLTR